MQLRLWHLTFSPEIPSNIWVFSIRPSKSVAATYSSPTKHESWIEGIHFKLDIHNKLEHDEFVVVGRSDGSHTLGRLKPVTSPDATVHPIHPYIPHLAAGGSLRQ